MKLKLKKSAICEIYGAFDGAAKQTNWVKCECGKSTKTASSITIKFAYMIAKNKTVLEPIVKEVAMAEKILKEKMKPENDALGEKYGQRDENKKLVYSPKSRAIIIDKGQYADYYAAVDIIALKHKKEAEDLEAIYNEEMELDLHTIKEEDLPVEFTGYADLMQHILPLVEMKK